jgi:hypothetical protein
MEMIFMYIAHLFSFLLFPLFPPSHHLSSVVGLIRVIALIMQKNIFASHRASFISFSLRFPIIIRLLLFSLLGFRFFEVC